MPDLNAAHVYAEVARASSFSAAARKLRMPVSTVSDRVAAFEAELGVKLLARTTRQVRLTDAGRELLSRIEPALREMFGAAEAASSLHQVPSGVLRISTPVDFSGEPLAKAFAEYSKKFPRVTLDVQLSNRYVDLVREGVDLALRGGELKESSLIVRRVGDGCQILVASPAYLRDHGSLHRIEDVTSHRTIDFNNGEGAGRAAWELQNLEGRKVRLQPEHGACFNSFSLVAEVARQGYGLAFIPEALVQRELRAGTLVRVLDGWSSKRRPVHLVYPKHHENTPKVREMVSLLAKHLASVFVRE